MKRFALAAIVLACATGAFAASDLSIAAEPYLTGGLFTNPLLPLEDVM